MLGSTELAANTVTFTLINLPSVSCWAGFDTALLRAISSRAAGSSSFPA